MTVTETSAPDGERSSAGPDTGDLCLRHEEAVDSFRALDLPSAGIVDQDAEVP